MNMKRISVILEASNLWDEFLKDRIKKIMEDDVVALEDRAENLFAMVVEPDREFRNFVKYILKKR